MICQAETIVEWMWLIAWTILSNTSARRKNPLFEQVFPSQAVIASVLSEVTIHFALGLLEIVQSTTIPTTANFKALPTIVKTTNVDKRWAIYLLVLEKPGQRPKIYVGSATHAEGGVHRRFQSYDSQQVLPMRVKDALDEGYTITHKGLLCWTAIPPASQIPKLRLLFILLEGTFAYVFWAMYTNKEHAKMAHLCQWDKDTLGYSGLCSHVSLYESVVGDFGLSGEQLQALDAQKKAIRAEAAQERKSNYHFQQMATNYHDYRERLNASRAATTAKDGGEHHRQRARDLAEKHRAAETFHCSPCKKTFNNAPGLKKHLTFPTHLNKAEELNRPFVCYICASGFDLRHRYEAHLRQVRHLKKAAAAM